MIAGVVGLLIGLFMYANTTRRGAVVERERYVDDPRDPPHLGQRTDGLASALDGRGGSPGREDETGRIADLLSRAAFGPTVARLVAFPRTSPHGDVLVAEPSRRPQGAVCCVSFGATGWIGALGVAPEARRRGLGRALTEAAIARLHAPGRDDGAALRHRHGPPALRAPGLRHRRIGDRVARDRRRAGRRGPGAAPATRTTAPRSHAWTARRPARSAGRCSTRCGP